MAKTKGMTYAGAGVDYEGGVDKFKLAAGAAGRTTANFLGIHGFRDVEWTRGESIHLIERDEAYYAVITEGLGTKGRVADAMYHLTGTSYHGNVAQCAMAMIVNDAITLGARPVEVSMYLAAGKSDWFKDTNRYLSLIHGWRQACALAQCSWGSGETPVLKNVIMPDTFDLAGAAFCVVEPKHNLIKANIRDGDAIVFVESSGIHANGLTLAIEIAERKDPWWRKVLNFVAPVSFPLKAMPNGYLTKLPDGKTYGEALLEPTIIYVQLMDALQKAGIDIHYAVNITGHGWRKLMRAEGYFTYTIKKLPWWPLPPIFESIEKYGPVDREEMYKTLNMGAGFALYVPRQYVSQIAEISNALHLRVDVVGVITTGEKKVVIEPLDITFKADSMNIR